MKILFLTAGPIDWGSSRFRCYWVAECSPDIDAIPMDYVRQTGQIEDGYDAYVFQKQGIPEAQKHLLDLGKQVWLDQCDPMWWFSPKEMKEIALQCTGVVCSNHGLANDFSMWALSTYGEKAPRTEMIPDRMKLGHYKRQRKHTSVTPVRFIWYGHSNNRATMVGAMANLERLWASDYSIELTVVDDRGETRELGLDQRFPLYQQKFTLKRENEILSNHDIALLPPYPGPWGKVKSNNKMLTAWACGLPVTDGFDYDKLVELVENHELRQELANEGRAKVEEDWDVHQSAKDWLKLVGGE